MPLDIWNDVHFRQWDLRVIDTWASRHHRSQGTPLFVQLFVQVYIKEDIKLYVIVLCEGNPLVDSPHKGPITQKVFTCQDLIMEKKIWTFIFWWCVTEVRFYGFNILQWCHISLKASQFTGHSIVCSKTCLGWQHRKHQCLKLTVLWYEWRKLTVW